VLLRPRIVPAAVRPLRPFPDPGLCLAPVTRPGIPADRHIPVNMHTFCRWNSFTQLRLAPEREKYYCRTRGSDVLIPGRRHATKRPLDRIVFLFPRRLPGE
jgi:hypothetical protein